MMQCMERWFEEHLAYGNAQQLLVNVIVLLEAVLKTKLFGT